MDPNNKIFPEFNAAVLIVILFYHRKIYDSCRFILPLIY
jgi:hypothetical protein